MSNDNKNEIREYLLGRITEAGTLENIEERLFSDDDFCSQVEIAEEELVHDYVFGKLNPADRKAFDEKIANNSELKFKAEMAEALKEKARQEEAVEAAPGFLASIKAFFAQPVYAGAFAVLLIGIFALSYFLLNLADDSQLAELKKLYLNERAIETRISGFAYAPPGPVTRGANTPDEATQRKLLLIDTRLQEAVINSPTAEKHYELGLYYLTQRKFAEAIKELSKAVELHDKNAKYHNELGSAYFGAAAQKPGAESTKNLDKANEEFTRATELDPTLLEALFNRSLALQEMKTLPGRAIESWNLYLQKDPSSKWADEARKNLEKLGDRPTSQKKDEEILDDFLTAFRAGDKETAWNIHSQTKGLFTDTPPFEQLSVLYLRARQRGDVSGSKEALEAMNYIGELENTDFFFTEAALYYKKIDDVSIDPLLKIKAMMTEGRNLRQAQQSVNALSLFEKGKQLLLQAGNVPESYIAEYQVASTLSDVGKIAESRTRLNSLLEAAQARKFKLLVPASYYSIGVDDGKQDDVSRSIINFQTALKQAEGISNLYEVKRSARELSSMYLSIGEQEKALIYLSKSLEDKEPYYSEPAQVCRHLLTASELFRKAGSLSSAIDFATESLSLSRESSKFKNDLVNDSLRNLTETLTEKGQFDKALEYANESNALALAKKQNDSSYKLVGNTFLLRGNLKSRMQKWEDALDDYERSLEYYKKLPELNYNVYDSHKGKLLCFQALNRQTEFDAEFETVHQLSEKYRDVIRDDNDRQAFFDKEQIVFDAAISNALKQNNPRKAFDLVETSKARSLLDFVKSEKSIAEVEKDFSSVSKPLSSLEIQARLPENTQVIQYAVLNDRLAIWTFTKERFEYSENPVRDVELEKKISEYVKAVRAKTSAADLKNAAQSLYKILLPQNIESEKTICLIPDKFLSEVPFSSLVSPSGKLLIENNPVFLNPSASVLIITSENAKQKEQATEERFLGVGNPFFDHEQNPDLADLPQAETEIETAAKDYPGFTRFMGAKATKDSFLSNFSNAEIIHFAGHFVVNDQVPAYSKLLFAGGDLRSFELAEHRLPMAKLVVLSACDTGFERYNRSEGAIGIARIFLAMGSPLIVASNWKVDSEATRDLMIAFHKNRKINKLNSAQSLQRAQLEIMGNAATAAPFYWSAFNPIGGYTNY